MGHLTPTQIAVNELWDRGRVQASVSVPETAAPKKYKETPAHKAWRLWYTKTPEFRAKERARRLAKNS